MDDEIDGDGGDGQVTPPAGNEPRRRGPNIRARALVTEGALAIWIVFSAVDGMWANINDDPWGDPSVDQSPIIIMVWVNICSPLLLGLRWFLLRVLICRGIHFVVF
jgi:hypothetical protein